MIKEGEEDEEERERESTKQFYTVFIFSPFHIPPFIVCQAEHNSQFEARNNFSCRHCKNFSSSSYGVFIFIFNHIKEGGNRREVDSSLKDKI